MFFDNWYRRTLEENGILEDDVKNGTVLPSLPEKTHVATGADFISGHPVGLELWQPPKIPMFKKLYNGVKNRFVSKNVQ